MNHRTPIQQMVDRACGYDPNAPRPAPAPPREPTPEEVAAIVAAGEALVRWSKRPSDPKRIAAMKAAAKRLREQGWT